MTTFAELGLSDAVLAAVDHLGYDRADPRSSPGHPARPPGARHHRRRQDRHGQDGRLLAAEPGRPRPAPSARRRRLMLVITPTRELAMQIQRSLPNHRPHPRPARRQCGGRREDRAADRPPRARRGRAHRHAGAPHRPHEPEGRRPLRRFKCSCWTRPIACSTWDFSPSGAPHRGGDAEKPPDTSVLGHHRQGPCSTSVDAMLDDPAIVQIAAQGRDGRHRGTVHRARAPHPEARPSGGTC